MEHMHQKLLIIDFGSQVTQLIARRLRELNVYCEIHPFQNVTEEFLTQFAPKAVILSGGPASVIDEGSPRPPMAVFEMGIPVLGICYGQQVMMHCLGGKVERGHGTAEFGRAYVSPKASLGLLDEPWRSCQRHCAGVRGVRNLAQCAIRCHSGPGPRILCCSISSRSPSHPERGATL